MDKIYKRIIILLAGLCLWTFYIWQNEIEGVVRIFTEFSEEQVMLDTPMIIYSMLEEGETYLFNYRYWEMRWER